ncbi:L-threonine 3-dehydrogenase [bacterium]|nr:L-threonine 3-dehydrogenase [bacterium]
MKAIAKTGPEAGAAMIETDIPRVGPRDVLVKVRATSICGTDLHIYNWDDWAKARVPVPMVFGHEFTGEVVERGADVTEIAIGDRVSAETHIVCGVCYQCRIGAKHICENTSIIGVDRPGCYAEYISIPAKNAWKNSPDMPDEIASIQEPLGNSVFAVTEGSVVTGKVVAIFGMGPFGQMAIAVAKAYGAAHIIAVEPQPYRRDMATRMGADYVIDPSTENVVERVKALVGGPHVDIVVDMSGTQAAIRDGFAVLTNGGRFTFFGLPSKRIDLDLANDIIFKGANVIGISGRKIWQTWYTVKEMLETGRLAIRPVITHIIPFEKFEDGFALMRSGECGKVVMKVVG